MSEDQTNNQPKASTGRALAMTVLPIASCALLAWILAKVSGLSFPFLLLVFCGIGYFIFLKDTPDFIPQAPQRKPRRRLTKEEVEARRAQRYYVGQDDDPLPSATRKKVVAKPKDTTQPANIVSADSLQNKGTVEIEDSPDGSEQLASPERQEKKLNPDRDLALKSDDL